MSRTQLNPPEGFRRLWETSSLENKSFSTIGVVVDLLSARSFSSGDWALTFTISDEPNGEGVNIKCRVFRKSEEELPRIGATGDVVVLRNFWLKGVSGEKTMTATAAPSDRASWSVFAGPDLRSIESPDELPFTQKRGLLQSPNSNIRRYAWDVFRAVGLALQPMSPQPGRQAETVSKFKLIQDLVVPRYGGKTTWADLLGEVTRIWPKDNRTEMVITDYTSHESLHDYQQGTGNESGRDGDEYNYVPHQASKTGPWGRRRMMITLWGEHSEYGRKLAVGSCLSLQNVRICLDSNETRMEGNMDATTKSKRMGILKMNDKEKRNNARYEAFMQRKHAYSQSLPATDQVEDEPTDQEKSKAPVPVELTTAQKRTIKNRLDKEKRKQRKKKFQSHNDAKPAKKSRPVNIRVADIPKNAIPVTIAEVVDTAGLVRQTEPEKEITLPFRNNIYHFSNIRVVDYNPPDLAYFAAPCWDQSHDSDTGSEDSDDPEPAVDEAGEQRWEWRFELVVEDASISQLSSTREKGRMTLLVCGRDADYLLRLKPSNLKKDSLAFQKLKQKLYLLWGDLEESKSAGSEQAGKDGEATKGPPFECVVKEYGVKPPGHESYERVFAMCSTTIAADEDVDGGSEADAS